MLEILALIWLGKRIGAIVRDKGRKAGGYQFLLVVMWFGGEIVGAIIGAILTGGDGLAPYIFALFGAAAGAGITFWIVNSLSTDTTALQQSFAPAPPLQAQGFGPVQSIMPSTPEPVSSEERLARLNDLRAKNLITEQEFQERRQEILRGL